MGKTLQAGEHQLVFTSGVNDRIADDNKFAKFVYKSILQFNRGDWGIVCAESWEANNADLELLNNGDRTGRILAEYGYLGGDILFEIETIWIIRNVADQSGSQVITVMFPSEY